MSKTKTISSKTLCFCFYRKNFFWQININPINKTKQKPKKLLCRCCTAFIDTGPRTSKWWNNFATHFLSRNPTICRRWYVHKKCPIPHDFSLILFVCTAVILWPLGIIPIFSLLDFSLCVRVRVFTYISISIVKNCFCFNQFTIYYIRIYLYTNIVFRCKEINVCTH